MAAQTVRSRLSAGAEESTDAGEMTLVDRLLDGLCDRLVRAEGGRAFRRRAEGLRFRGRRAQLRSAYSSWPWACRCSRATARPRSRRSSAPTGRRDQDRHRGPDFRRPQNLPSPADGEILVRNEGGDEGLLARSGSDRQAIDGTAGCIPRHRRIRRRRVPSRSPDRKKDIIVLSGGDNVAPAGSKDSWSLQPEIAQAMVHGDKHPHIVALIVPDADFCGRLGEDPSRRP